MDLTVGYAASVGVGVAVFGESVAEIVVVGVVPVVPVPSILTSTTPFVLQETLCGSKVAPIMYVVSEATIGKSQ